MSVNRVILVGRVGKTPDIRKTNSGTEIASFSLATSESWKDRDSGDRKEKTEWVNISVFNENLVNVVKNYVNVGSQLYIEGKLQTRKYEKDGVDRYVTEVVLQNFGGTIVLLNKPEDKADKPQSKPAKSHGVDESSEIPF